jgi:cytochrome c oxidase subunit 1
MAAFITGAVQLVFVFNVFWSMFKGKKAAENPWEATTLEWTIPSPPPHDNFAGKHPVVYRGAYDFAVPGTERDYVMQNSPEKVTAES